MPEPAPVALSGNLRLVCADAPGRGTYLAEQSFAAPIHLSKSYWDGDTLLVNLVNQTAGIFGGDCIRANVIVEDGARVLLSSPSAARFHPSKERESIVEQRFEIRAGGSLDVLPEIAIPQRGSRSRQRTSIHVDLGGELIYLETLTPGRVESGEIFAFTSYAWATDIRVGGRLVLRERAELSPGGGSLAGLRALHSASYHASMVVIPAREDALTDVFARDVAGISKPPCWLVGASRLAAHGWSLRILAGDAIAFQEALRKVRAVIYQRLGRRQPDARRNGL